MAHLGRIQHQRYQWKKLKGKMTKEDLLLLVDWSENYSCKYIEVQSVHFGGSHQELSLHTGMVAKQGYDETFCTIPDCKKHGPLAIFSHLKPILARHVTGETSRLHFMSDSPSSQYRSKTMFYVICKLLGRLYPHIKAIEWNYSKSGHGKNVADGSGANVKSKLDRLVAHGTDCENFEKAVTALQNENLKTYIHAVSEKEILDLEKENPIPKLQSFKGTSHWIFEIR